ncbi:MAG: mitochondrial 54S ribosomal protein mrpl1 [Cirrosporium novae-zelandiae]|nr:MAG: mitochondrial 54S ribosomal protein mrpl1 [Cirrosporium novae-zelandiae]
MASKTAITKLPRIASSLLPSSARLPSTSLRPRIILPRAPASSSQQVRYAGTNTTKYKRNKDAPKKKKGRTTYITYDLKDAEQFALCDAIRTNARNHSYIRSFEVGRPSSSPKYDLAIKLRTTKNGPTLKSRLRLPNPVSTTHKVCVICAPTSSAATAAKKAGAHLVGEEEVFQQIRDGKIDFDRCVCHVDSQDKLKKSGVARILGPKKLMPNAKMGTIVKDVATAVRDMVGGCSYRERMGVIRISIGRLSSTPEEVMRNVQHFMQVVKQDVANLPDGASKEVHEVVLSSTNSPGFSLNGDFRSAESVPTKDLCTPL